MLDCAFTLKRSFFFFSFSRSSVSGNKVKYIPAGILQKTQKLAKLELKGNPLKRVDPYAFSFLPNLTKL